jgi:phage replication initiation protein
MQRTKVDWLAGRARVNPGALMPALVPVFGHFGQFVRIEQRSRGWMGYECSADLRVMDMTAGMVAWGGDHQRGWAHVSITGQGCDWVPDWDAAQDSLSSLDQWEPRRVDIALDTFKRETSHEDMLAAYRAGGFTTRGRPPKCQQIIGEDPADGRTIYVGSRTSDKFLRGYEKGLQLARPGATHIDGVPVEDWYRVECEFKAKEGPLPQDIIDRRDQYLAGAYPYLQTLLADVEPEILVNLRERIPQLDLAAALEQVRTQYGRTLFTALVAYGGDFGAVWSKVVGTEHSLDLVRAGVLLVDHE